MTLHWCLYKNGLVIYSSIQIFKPIVLPIFFIHSAITFVELFLFKIISNAIFLDWVVVPTLLLLEQIPHEDADVMIFIYISSTCVCLYRVSL